MTPDDLGKRTYLSIPQLAEYLSKTVPAVRSWLIVNPEVRRSREGNNLVIWRRDVDAVLAAHAAKHASERVA